MSENIVKDAQEIKKRLALMGYKDISESTICELLKSFGSHYEVEFVTDMIIGTNDGNLFELQDNLMKPGPSNVTSAKPGNMESTMKKDEIDGEGSNDSTSDTDDDYYFSTSWEDNSFMDATPQSSPPLLPAIELHSGRPVPDHSNNSTCGTVDIEIFEENNNDPNNNLDVIQILQEQRTYATSAEPQNQLQEAETAERLASPKPGCSKDLSDAESLTLNSKLRDEALQICNLLPRFKYATVYKALFKSRHIKNRIEVVLWDLLPQKRPLPQYLNKRKITDDSCIVECKKSLSKLAEVESQNLNDLSTLLQDRDHSSSTKNIESEKCNTLLNDFKNNLSNQSSIVKTVASNPIPNSSMHDVSNASSSANSARLELQKNAQGNKVTVAEHFKSTLNQCLPKGKTKNSSSQPALLRPAKLIVQKHPSPPVTRITTSSSTILAPAKLIYSNAPQRKHEMEVDAQMPSDNQQRERFEKTLKLTRPISVNTAHISGNCDSIPSNPQSLQNYMKYLQMVQNTKKRNLSGIPRCNMTRDDIKNFLYSQRRFGNRNTIFSKIKQNTQNVVQAIGKDTNMPHTNRSHNGNGNISITTSDVKGMEPRCQAFNEKLNRRNIPGSILQARLSLLDKNPGVKSSRPASFATLNENMPFRKDEPSCSTASNNVKPNNVHAESLNISLENAIAQSLEVPSASSSTSSITELLSNAKNVFRVTDNPLSEIASTSREATGADHPFLQSPSTSQAGTSHSDDDSNQMAIAMSPPGKPVNSAIKDSDPLPLCISLHPGYLQTYKELTVIFPRVDNGYITELCQQHINKNGFIDQSELLNSLIDALLANGDAHPATTELDEIRDGEEFDKNEQYSNLLEILPDADPVYLRNAIEKMYNEPDAMVEFVQSKLENPDYPTREQFLMRMKITQQQKQYTTEFSLERFLEIFPDPFAHFENPKRKCKFSAEAFEFLKSYFDQIEANAILEEYNRCEHHLTLTTQSLEEMHPRASNGHSVPLMTTEDIPLLQEFAFIEHQAEIRRYCDELKAREVEEFKQFKKRNELFECQCCFDSECLPSKCSTCDDGHVFCNSCILFGTESKLAEGETRVPCFVDCDTEFSLSVLQRVLPPTKFSILLRKRQQAEVMAAGLDGLVSCPFCHFASIPPTDDKVFKCLNPECMKETCRACKELNHIPFKCYEKRTERARLFLEERMTEALVRKCCRCQKPYFKDDGCNKISCNCGAIMCYICDAEIKDYNHFNGQGSSEMSRCPLWSDNHVINAKAVLKVAEETMKDIKEKEPDVELNAQGLLPTIPNRTIGPHEDVPNANVMPERVNRRIRYST